MDALSVCGLDPEILAQGIETEKNSILIIDSRPFISYNEGHIIGACNVHCPPILKRRSGGFVALQNIVPCRNQRDRLENGQFSKVVVYDDDTVTLEQSAKDSNLYSVLKSLRQQVEISNLFYITGGYEEFKKVYQFLCEGQGKLNPTLSLRPDCRSTSRNTTAEPVEILPHLYLGNFQDASNLELLHRLGITELMNVSRNCKNHFEDNFTYMNIPVDDNDSADLSVWFPQTISFIDAVKFKGGKILVHCQAGISRSATICLAYLMFTAKVDLETAFEHVRSRRSVISPNLNFMRQLQLYQNELETNCKLSTSLSDASIDSSIEISSDSSGAQSGVSGSSSSFSQEAVYNGSAFDFSFSTAFSTPNTPLLSPS